MRSAIEGGHFASLAVPDAAPGDAFSGKAAPLHSKPSAAREGALVEQSGPVWSQAPVGPMTEPCELGGTITISGEIASQSTVSPGDEVTIVFDECADGEAVIDGTFSMTVVAFSGSLETGTYSMSASVDLAAFESVAEEETVAIDGAAALAIEAALPRLEFRLSSDSLVIETNGSLHALTDYSLVQSVDAVTGDYSIEASGRVSSSRFEGEALFETVEPFVGFAGLHPHIGELLITGDGGATIRAITLDDAFVRIEVDLDGDGRADFNEDVAWETLTTS